MHAAGEADLNVYAYVHGHLLSSSDPLALGSFDLGSFRLSIAGSTAEGSTVGAAHAGADLGLTAGMTEQQATNMARFAKKSPAGNEGVLVRHLPNEGFALQSEVPGRVPGSYALYEKQAAASGETVQFTKTTFDPAGAIVHVKDKLTGVVATP